MFHGVRSRKGTRWLCSEWYCMIGAKQAAAAERRYSSALGISPENPPRSQLQKKMPHAPAVRPAVIEARNASQVDSSSPAQWHGNDAEPVKPARLNVVPERPSFSSSS